MFRLLRGIFDVAKAILDVLGYMLNGIKAILSSIPRMVAYINACLGILPTFVIALFGVGLSFLILKAIYKYTM